MTAIEMNIQLRLITIKRIYMAGAIFNACFVVWIQPQIGCKIDFLNCNPRNKNDMADWHAVLIIEDVTLLRSGRKT